MLLIYKSYTGTYNAHIHIICIVFAYIWGHLSQLIPTPVSLIKSTHNIDITCIQSQQWHHVNKVWDRCIITRLYLYYTLPGITLSHWVQMHYNPSNQCFYYKLMEQYDPLSWPPSYVDYSVTWSPVTQHLRVEFEFVLFNDAWCQWGHLVWCMTILFPALVNHQIRYQATQSGLSAWWLQMATWSFSDACIGIYGLTYSLHHPRTWGVRTTGKLVNHLLASPHYITVNS